MNFFTKNDLKAIDQKGLDLKAIEDQLSCFETKTQTIDLDSAAHIGHGIVKIPDQECQDYASFYESQIKNLSVVKFVPASGAASRMFKSMYQFLNDYRAGEETINSYINRTNSLDLFLFFVTVEKLPFHDVVFQTLKQQHPDYKSMTLDQRRLLFIQLMLDEKHFNFGHFPKGLLPFHNYKTHVTTAFEEHLIEASQYANVNGKSTLHFTISQTHHQQFKDHFNAIKTIVEAKTKTSFELSYSFQDPKTDTLALNMDNSPFKVNGELLFRPSGHGALLKNLNAIQADLIFIKNIDNVVMEPYLGAMIFYKKVLAGLLLKLQSKLFFWAHKLEATEITEDTLQAIVDFLRQDLNVYFPQDFEKYASQFKREYLKSKIHRPIRVCGMVKNEGEPGGGPFWVKSNHGDLSLQIVELSQIDTKLASQRAIIQSATHFNPVDLVCGVKNYKGECYDLEQFMDVNTHFVAIKNKFGQKLKTLERPGLWNGSMANWNTVFVEVPLSTFNPVKKVNDLLKAQHQLES